jgi:hypothetical protein
MPSRSAAANEGHSTRVQNSSSDFSRRSMPDQLESPSTAPWLVSGHPLWSGRDLRSEEGPLRSRDVPLSARVT